jgi:hypothetical protein
MRMWMLDPKMLCTQHLFGEHYESHSIIGAIQKGRINSIKGLIRTGVVELPSIYSRHEELHKEMGIRKNKTYDSQLPIVDIWETPKVNTFRSMRDLFVRCSNCRKLIQEYLGRGNLL